MRITLLCSAATHPIVPHLQRWMADASSQHIVELVERKSELKGGDLLFLISCHEVISLAERSKYLATLIIHASDLPEGRGWSPHVWQILEGRNEIVVTLLEAEDNVDTGAIWAQRRMRLAGHELCDEINAQLFTIELELMNHAVAEFNAITPKDQDDRKPTYFPRRKPEDSRLDPLKTIAEQFDLLRVADPHRFPAFFELRGYRYIVRLEKVRPS